MMIIAQPLWRLGLKCASRVSSIDEQVKAIDDDLKQCENHKQELILRKANLQKVSNCT